VFLFFRLTYLVQLLYLENLSRPKYHEFSLKLLILLFELEIAANYPVNGECQFHVKSHELISAFLACPPD